MSKEIKRKCQGCFETFDRCDLIKITRLSDTKIKINPSSKELGRSVYVCKNVECVKKFIKKKRVKSGLKVNNFDEISRVEEELKKMFDL